LKQKFDVTCINCETVCSVVVDDVDPDDIYNVEFCPFCGDVLDKELDLDDELLYPDESEE